MAEIKAVALLIFFKMNHVREGSAELQRKELIRVAEDLEKLVDSKREYIEGNADYFVHKVREYTVTEPSSARTYQERNLLSELIDLCDEENSFSTSVMEILPDRIDYDNYENSKETS